MGCFLLIGVFEWQDTLHKSCTRINSAFDQVSADIQRLASLKTSLSHTLDAKKHVGRIADCWEPPI
jgi:hypothetical protein